MIQIILAISLTIIKVSCHHVIEVKPLNQSSETNEWGGPSVQMLTSPTAISVSGLLFDHQAKTLYYTDRAMSVAYRMTMKDGKLTQKYIYTPDIDGEELAFFFPKLGKQGEYLIGAGSYLLTYNEPDNRYSNPDKITEKKGYTIAHVHNDARSVVWITLNSNNDKEHKGGLLVKVYYSPQEIKQYKTDVGDFSWGKSYRTMYIVADNGKTIYKYKYNDGYSELDLDSEEVFHKVPAEDMVITGIKVNLEGCVWITITNYGVLVELSPAGKIKQVIQLPVTQPRGITVGDGRLYIASSKKCNHLELAGGSVLFVSGINGTDYPERLPNY